MKIRELNRKCVDISSELFDLFHQFYGSVHKFDYHLLHRYSNIISLFEKDKKIATKVLISLLVREGRIQPLKVKFLLPRTKIPMPFFGKASIGAHSKSSKYLLKKENDFLSIFTQLISSKFVFKNYKNIDCPKELSIDMKNVLNRFHGYKFIENIEKHIGIDKICDKIIRQVNFKSSKNDPLKIGKFIVGGKLIIPRPSNNFVKSVLSVIGDDNHIKMIGHNFSYEPAFSKDQVQKNFPLFLKTNIEYYDDIRALKQRKFSLSNKSKSKILVSMFPFGDTGYAEGECNHFYQIGIINTLKEILIDYKKDVIFCLHPSTKQISIIQQKLSEFNVSIGLFDKFLYEARLVICTYRSTSCLVQHCLIKFLPYWSKTSKKIMLITLRT